MDNVFELEKNFIDSINNYELKTSEETEDNIFDNQIVKSKKFWFGEVKNRLYFENLTDNQFFDINGIKSEIFNYYEKVSKSGIGVIITGGVYAGLKCSKQHNKIARFYNDDDYIDSFSKVVSIAHQTGSKIFLKIKSIYGRNDLVNKLFGVFKVSASRHRSIEDSNERCIRVSDSKIFDIIDSAAEITSLSIRANFDGVVIDAGYDNLFGELSSSEFNRRKFGYFSNELDLLHYLLKKIKIVSGNQIIIVKINLGSLVSTLTNESYKLIKTLSLVNQRKSIYEFIIKLAKIVEFGADGFIFEFGTNETAFLNQRSQFGLNISSAIFKLAKEYFEECKIKNKFGEDILLFQGEGIENNNVADFYNITRDILADENYLKKYKSENFVPCIDCSLCNLHSRKNGEMYCAVNPKLIINKNKCRDEKEKNIVIVGAGLAGIYSAICLVEKNYNVKIYESNSKINLNSRYYEIFGYDKKLKKLNDYLENVFNKYVKAGKINLILEEQFSTISHSLKDSDGVIIATGAKKNYFTVKGAVLKNVISIFDCLKDKSNIYINKKIVIYARSEISLKYAIFVAKSNNKVTVIIDKNINNFDVFGANFINYLHILRFFKAEVYFNVHIKQINEDYVEIIYNKNFSSNYLITALNLMSNSILKYEERLMLIDHDIFVYEPSLIPNSKLLYDIVKSGYKGEIFVVGNALEVSNIGDILSSAFYVCKNL